MSQRIGELLGQIIPLSPQDVHEILAEQEATRSRFGDAALALGLCKPEHLWQAWAGQADSQANVSLDSLGVDSQAVQEIDVELLRRVRMLPLRAMDDLLVIAVDQEPSGCAIEAIRAATHKNVRFVRVDANELSIALERYLPVSV